MLTNNKKDVTVKVNDIKSIKSIQKKINENDKITFIITTTIKKIKTKYNLTCNSTHRREPKIYL